MHPFASIIFSFSQDKDSAMDLQLAAKINPQEEEMVGHTTRDSSLHPSTQSLKMNKCCSVGELPLKKRESQMARSFHVLAPQLRPSESLRMNKCWSDEDIPFIKRKISEMQLPTPLMFGTSNATTKVARTITNSNMTTDNSSAEVRSTSITAETSSTTMEAQLTSAMRRRATELLTTTDMPSRSCPDVMVMVPKGVTVQICWNDKPDKIYKCWFDGSFHSQGLDPGPSQTARVVDQPGYPYTVQLLETTSTAEVPTATTTSSLATNGSTTEVLLTDTLSNMCISNTVLLDTNFAAMEPRSMEAAKLPMAERNTGLPETSTRNTPATYPDGIRAEEMSGKPKYAKSLHEWTSEEKLNFIRNVADWTNGNMIRGLETDGARIVRTNWTGHICSKVYQVMQSPWKNRRVSYDGARVQDLLRFIRNVFIHYHQLPEDVRTALGKPRDKVLDYFTKRSDCGQNRLPEKTVRDKNGTVLLCAPYAEEFCSPFELKEPLIHQLHEEQVKLFKDFIGCYVKPEVKTSLMKLENLDIRSSEKLLKPECMFIGAKVQKIVKKSARKDHIVRSFFKKVEDSYIACGKTLQDKLPISKFLKTVAAIHPDARGPSLSLAYLQRFPTLASNFLTEDELDKYDMEVRRFQTYSHPEFKKGQCVDHWWGSGDTISRYPCLSKMVMSLLGCFHGSQVESTFNVMNDIIDSKSGTKNIENQYRT